jgi:hypothetical protein
MHVIWITIALAILIIVISALLVMAYVSIKVGLWMLVAGLGGLIVAAVLVALVIWLNWFMMRW